MNNALSNNIKKFLSSLNKNNSLRLKEHLLSAKSVTKTVWISQEAKNRVKIKKLSLPYCSEKKGIYSFDLSSALCAYPLSIVQEKKELLLDYCAAPGGKAIWATIILKPKLLIANEAVKKRIPQLIYNLKIASLPNVVVTSLSIQKLSGISVDIALADVPCSGQSLFTEKKAPLSSFHPSVINRCANRQRKILSLLAQQIVEGGYMLYSTCTFSLKENEKNIEWFLKKFPQFQTVEIPELSPFQSKYTDSFYCYRFWPWQRVGRGGFSTLLQCSSSKYKRSFLGDIPIFWSNVKR